MRSTVALFLLFAVGCARVPDVAPRPLPDDSLADVQAPYRELRLAHARLNREAARMAREGKIKTQADESAFLDVEMSKARQEAMAPFTKLEQDALGDGRWTPERMATFREALADALEAER